MHNLPYPLKVSQQTLLSFLIEITRISIDFLTPKHQSDTYVITVKMEILLEPTSNKLLVDSILQAGNPVKEILFKLNLPDHRILKDGGEGSQILTCLCLWFSEQVGLAGDLGSTNDVLIPQVYNWETAMYGKILYDEDVHYLRFFEKEFPAIVYNDALASKSDFSYEPMVRPQHVDEVNLKNETLLSDYDDEKHNVISFNDLLPFNIFSVNDLKLKKDDDDDNIDMKQSLGDLSIKPLPNLISIDVEDQHLYDIIHEMRKVMAFQTLLSKFSIILDQLLDLEVLTSCSNTTDVEDQQLIF
ncbi:hypothetical protein Tco_1354215 [Tanacetum coccineum]